MLLKNEKIKKKIQIKLDEIVHYLITLKQRKDLQTGLFTGSAGIAIFLFYYSRYKKSDFIAEKAMSFLSHSVNNIDNNLYSPFCGGISGICWSIHHLIANEFIDSDNIEVVESFDRYLCDQIAYHSSFGNYDFLHGTTGSIFYLLKRINIPLVRQTTENMISLLYHLRIEDNHTCYWKSKIGNDINVSLSHGISSICVFLCKAFEANIHKSICQELLKKSISFLLSQEINFNDRISMFPSFNKTAHPLYSRLGWCYGDLGIAMAIWHYAITFNDKLMKKKAMEIFIFSSKRKGGREDYVIDGSICHGTAGIALIFKKIFFYTKQVVFKEMAEFWIEQTLLMSKFEDGIVGYKSNEKDNSIDLLNGVAGIGLVLLSFLTNENTNWDESLLLS